MRLLAFSVSLNGKRAEIEAAFIYAHRPTNHKCQHEHVAIPYQAAWHKNTFEVNPTLSDSWSVYRGYQTVRVLEREVSGTVIGSSSESVTVHQFYRGMYGDLNNDGTTKTNTVSTAEWGPANDYNWLTGREAEVLTETAGSTVLSTTDTSYWADQTASMAMVAPNPNEVAKEVQPTTTMIRQPNTDGTTRRHEVVDVHYEASDPRSISNGAVTRHIDAGDMAITDSEANCTSTVYVANSSRYLLAPEVVETDAGRASGADCLGAVLSHQEYFYDQTTDSSTPPTQGNLDRVKTQLNVTPVYANTYATYDGYGRVLTAKDANGYVTTTTYLPSTGRPDSVKVDSPPLASLGVNTSLSTTTALDKRGLATTITDANSKSTTQTYDALGRLTSVVAPTETLATPTFTAAYTVDNAHLSSVHTKNLLTSGGVYRDTWTYVDAWLRTREVHTSTYGGVDHLTTQTRYDDTGEVAASSSPYRSPGAINGGGDFTPPAGVPLEVDNGYDSMHRVTNQSRTVNGAQPWGHTITTYKADKIITTPPVPAPVTTATIDVWGRPRASTESSQIGDGTPSSTTTNTYDPLGRLLSVADDAGKTNTYVYDVAGRRISATDADAGTSSSTYDGVGNLLNTTDALGDTLTTTYDEINRPKYVTSTKVGFTADHLVDYTYDSAPNGKGRPATVTVHDLGGGTGPWVSTVGGYDSDGRVLSSTYTLPPVSGLSSGISYTTSSTFNPDGSPATVTDTALGDLSAETMTYGYDTTGGVTGLPVSMSGPFNATASYSNLRQLTGRTYGDSTSSGYTTRAYDYTADPLRRLSNVTTTVTHNAVPQVQNDTFTYDSLDEPTRISGGAPGDSGQQTCFTYDGLDRLKTAWTEATDCSNWTATTAAGPYGFNQQFGYSTNGKPAWVKNLDVQTLYTAGDTANHPHAITGFGTANTYAYDADGQQTNRTISGTSTTLSWDPLHHLYQSVSGASTTKYVNGADGSRIARLDPDGSTTIWLAGHEVHVASGVVTATRYYSFAGATIAQRNASGLTWLASDGQNSRQIAVNATTGAATRTYYLPYGAQRTGAPLLPTDQNFLGRVLDSSGLLQDGARYYDPTIGQFVSPDPLADTSDNTTLDPYGYGADNPVAVSDSSGLHPLCDRSDICGTTGSGSTNTPSAPTTLTITAHVSVKLTNPNADEIETGFWDYANHHGYEPNDPTAKGAYGAEVEMWAQYCGDNAGASVCGASLYLDLFEKKNEVNQPRMEGVKIKSFVIAGSCTSDCSLAQTLLGVLLAGLGSGGLRGGPGPARVGSSASSSAAEAESGLARTGATCGLSFSADTQVLLANGKTKPISKLKAGDRIVTTNTQSGKQRVQPVQALLMNYDSDLLDLVLVNGAGKRSLLHTTGKHPIWDESTHAWVGARRLVLRHLLHTADGQELRVLALITPKITSGEMWDLTVARDHDFYVRAGAASILVHNCGIGETVAQHIGDRPLNGVPKGGAADYVEGLIHNPGPLVRSRVVNRNTGEMIYIDEANANIFIYQPMSEEGGTVFSRPSLDSARTYFEEFGR